MSESDAEYVDRLSRVKWDWIPGDHQQRLLSLAHKGAEADALSARVKDLTLEGLAHIGRLEAVREVLAGTDIGSLPKDYPTLQMAQDRMAELAALRARVERLRAALEDIADGLGETDLIEVGRYAKHIARAALGDTHE